MRFNPAVRSSRCLAFAGLALALQATLLPSTSVAGEKTSNVTQPDANTASSTAAALRSSRSFNEAPYKKASELSVRPSPIDDIRVPSPDKAPATGIVTTKVTLFVDEKGKVAHIGFDEAALAQPFRDAVRTAFAKARFKPGRIGDKPVKSRMRIEVTFEPNKPTNSAGGSVDSRRRDGNLRCSP